MLNWFLKVQQLWERNSICSGNQKPKAQVLSMSGKCFSKTEFLFLVSNLEAQSLDIQYCKKKKNNFFKVWDSRELWNIQSPEQIPLSPMHLSLLLEFYYLAFLWVRAFVNKTRGNLISKNCVGFQSLPAGWLQSSSSSYRMNPINSGSWVLLLLQVARHCPAFQLRLQPHPAGILQSTVSKKGFLLMWGFFTQPSRFSHLIGQEYSILA